MAFSTEQTLGIDLSTTTTTADFPLGMIVNGNDGAQYMYVRADEALAQYAAVKIDDDFECSELTTTLSGVEPTSVGFPQVAFSDTYYGWVAVSGYFKVLAAASCAADVKIGTTTTAGVLDDTYTDLCQGLKLTATNGASQAAVQAFSSGRVMTNAQD